MRKIAMGAMMLLLAGAIAGGDEVLFKNGDRLTGTIKEAVDGKLTLKGTVAGDLVIDMAKVKSFSTDRPVTLHLKDGRVLTQKVSAAAGGIVEPAASPQGPWLRALPTTLPVADVATINAPPVRWTGSVTASAMFARGNSNTDNASASLEAIRRAKDDRITLGAGYYYGREEDDKTGEKFTSTDNWFALAKYDYFVSKRLYVYGLTKAERDNIAGLNLRLSPGAGVGYQWIERSDMKFATEAGVSWIYESYEQRDSADEHMAARLAYHLDRKFNDKLRFFHNLEFLPSVEDAGDFNVNADVGIRASLTEKMFTEFKVEWKYDSLPAPGAAENDLRYILGVGWSF